MWKMHIMVIIIKYHIFRRLLLRSTQLYPHISVFGLTYYLTRF